MTFKKIVSAGAIAGALGFSAVGLAGVANAAPTPPAVIQHAQLAGWGGPGWHGPGGGGWHGPGGPGFGGPGWHGPGFGGPGLGWRGPGWGGPGWGAGWGGPPLPPPCPFGLCI